MAIMVFDIETVPDVVTGRRINKIDPNLDQLDVIKILYLINRQKKQGSEFLQHYLHKIVAISVLVQDEGFLKIWSLGNIVDDEQNLLERFFNGLEIYKPTLVSWNGTGFDLPVIHYRSLLHQVTSKMYWETGERVSEFKWNNYLNRYHYRHIDIMDLLSGYQKSAVVSLDDIATMLGLPGKMVLTGDQVLNCYLTKDLPKIRDYCEIDVLNTYLVFLRLQYIRGVLSQENYLSSCDSLKIYLKKLNTEHFNNFLENWDN
ncbi:MAG: 3'-5' exonuclease [Gammaproteobacteria bacterium]|jgi:predicted PolB exonuclease-like 3'-5' exonuclease